MPPSPTTIQANATAITGYVLLEENDPALDADDVRVPLDEFGGFRPGQSEIKWIVSNAGSSNLGSSVQKLNVRPLVNLSADQFVDESGAVTVTVSLNGSAATYPVTVNYDVGYCDCRYGSRCCQWFGQVTSPDLSADIVFNVVDDGVNDPDETVIFTLGSLSNANPVVGHGAVTIIEDNQAPQVELMLMQAGQQRAGVYANDGAVAITAVVTDANSNQTHSFDWSTTNNALTPPGDVNNWQVEPVSGTYLLEVLVTDSGGRFNRRGLTEF